MDTQDYAGWHADRGGHDDAVARVVRRADHGRARLNPSRLAARPARGEPRFDPAVVAPLLAAAMAAPQIMSGRPIFLDDEA
jgi:hypothetical protein